MEMVFSVVLHPIKRELGITTLQYMMADSIYHLSHGGWCIATRPYFAKLFDCDRSTVQRNLAKLEEKLLVERDPKTDYLRTTDLWRDTVIFRERLMMSERLNEPPQNAAPPPQNAAPTRRKMRPNSNNIDSNGKIKDFTTPNVAPSNAKKIPPNLEDVVAYFIAEGPARGLPAESCEHEANQFFNRNVGCDWKMSGGRGATMKNWHACSNTWIGNAVSWARKRGGQKEQPRQQKPQGSQMSMLHDLFNANET
jgi:hypothetical protein